MALLEVKFDGLHRSLWTTDLGLREEVCWMRIRMGSVLEYFQPDQDIFDYRPAEDRIAIVSDDIIVDLGGSAGAHEVDLLYRRGSAGYTLIATIARMRVPQLSSTHEGVVEVPYFLFEITNATMDRISTLLILALQLIKRTTLSRSP